MGLSKSAATKFTFLLSVPIIAGATILEIGNLALSIETFMGVFIAFVVGILPLMFATGAGAESRISLGTAVVFGMALNAIIGTLFVPNFWDVMQRIQERFISPNKLESPSENNNSLDHN